MSNINGIPYSNPRNINLQGVSSTKGSVLRFARTSSTNPLDSTSNGLYVNASNQLIFSSQGTSTVLGTTGGSGSVPSFEALYANDQTFAIGGSTFTIDRTAGNGDVVTITNTGAGSGDCIQITNVGTGKDINGTSGTWSFSKAGAATLLTAVLAGTDATDSFTMTLGDAVISDGSLTITDADNAASFSLTNNTATTATIFKIAGSGTFTGSTTTSFITLTASGLTSGTAVYIPVAALDTGRAVHIVANALTSGIVFNVTSSATAITGNGRLFLSTHSGATGTSATLNEFITAANDETVLLKLTASAALALGTLLQVSASSLTTGKAITANDLDALTTGMGLHIASAATAITTTGRLFLSDHTGATGTSATLNEFKSAANDETIVLQVTAASLTSGTVLALSATAVDTGKIFNLGTNTGLTTGQGIILAHTTSVIADGGSMLRLSSTGINTGGATNGTMLDVQTTAQVAGTQVLFKAGAVTTGVVLSVISTTGMTSGSLIRATSSTAGAVATNGAISFRATGAFTSTSNVGFVDILASATTAGTVVRIASSAAGQTATELLRVDASGFTTGYTGSVATFTSASTTGDSSVILVTAGATTAGNGIKVVANALTLGAATGILVSHTTSVLGAGTSLLRLSSTGVDTGSTTGVLLDLASTSHTTATLALITDSSADTSARVGFLSKVTNAAAVLAVPIKTSNVAVVNSKFTKQMSFTDGTKTVVVWLDQDATDPNGTLSGTAGDICLNGPNNKIHICTGTTNWTTL